MLFATTMIGYSCQKAPVGSIVSLLMGCGPSTAKAFSAKKPIKLQLHRPFFKKKIPHGDSIEPYYKKQNCIIKMII